MRASLAAQGYDDDAVKKMTNGELRSSTLPCCAVPCPPWLAALPCCCCAVPVCGGSPAVVPTAHLPPPPPLYLCPGVELTAARRKEYEGAREITKGYACGEDSSKVRQIAVPPPATP